MGARRRAHSAAATRGRARAAGAASVRETDPPADALTPRGRRLDAARRLARLGGAAPRALPPLGWLVARASRARLPLRRDAQRRDLLDLLRPLPPPLVPAGERVVTHAALWCKSNFSFLEGASHPDELVEEAQRHGLSALALTDRDGVYGVVRAHTKARELGLHLIVGSELTLLDGSTIVLLAQTRAGYANLCQLITVGRLRSPKGECAVACDEVCSHSAGIVALWGGPALSSEGGGAADGPARSPDTPRASTALLEAFGDRLYALLARHRSDDEVQREQRWRAQAARWNVPTVAASEVLYHRSDRRRLQDVLTCIRHGTSISQAGRKLRPNAEHDLKTRHAFAALFADDPLSVARTNEVAERCAFALDQIRYRYPSERLPDGRTSAQWLRELTFDGARERYRGAPPEAARAQLEKELALIEELDYCGYFLTMREIVEFCRARDILCQGRGSAANSAVCYCLGVTAIDPVRMGLLFERFLSKERAEPPDIDLDIEHERREEVIQHVYAKYTRSHAAMVANVIRYRARSSVRDVGKALSFPESLLARITRVLSHSEGLTPQALAAAGVEAHSREAQLFCELVGEIEDFPRHLSIHPGGFLLGHEPVATLVPVENATMEGRTVIQWDKDDVEAIGLFKVDLLALGSLNHLHRAFELIRRRHGRELELATIPPDDPQTFEQICAGDTVGVFQIESRAQMAMLPRLRPRTYYDLVIEVSIVRPGPISGGMVHPYLRRRRGEEAVEYPHECLRPVLEKTLGVPLFQEQVMRLAIVAADYTPGEADQLRRDMAAWKKSGRIGQHREKLVTRMQRKGIAPEFAERVFQQIQGFGEYGFPESHAASFALLSYAGAWLRRHYLLEFTCALLNAQPMGFYSIATIVDDAVRHGLEVRAVDVTRSDWDSTPESLPASGAQSPSRDALRMGLRTVRSLSFDAFGRIARARETAPFSALDDFARRTRLDQRALSALAEAGAFESFEDQRRSALWKSLAAERMREPTLFELDERPTRFEALSHFEEIGWDYERTRHSTRGHPLSALRPLLTERKLPDARTLNALPHGTRTRYAGIVICRQRPGTASGVTFMTLEDESGFVNLVVWTQVFERYALIAKTETFLGVTGRIQSEDGVTHLIAERLWKPKLAVAPPDIASRDFH
ncbi:MAG: error-prone DNA polymerase [Planctomycetes bacterium]|nr:error-prone DNA polymerase [Planctomycetota bacterium]